MVVGFLVSRREIKTFQKHRWHEPFHAGFPKNFHSKNLFEFQKHNCTLRSSAMCFLAIVFARYLFAASAAPRLHLSQRSSPKENDFKTTLKQ